MALTVEDPTLVALHNIALAALLPSTVYYYRAISRDAAGNVAVSDSLTFTTLPATPLPAPPPTASFVATPAQGPAPLTITFTDTSSG